MNSEQTGKLYLVATPIGNLEDITLRAIRILKEVDVIACEDTRRTAILLNHYDIKKHLVSYHSYTSSSKTSSLIETIAAGKNAAYVTDGGTPGISDPGEILVREAIKNKIPVESIPGPSALVSALVCSGLPANGFVFLGFLQRKPGKIRKALKKASELGRTIIFYESPFRVKKTIGLCTEVFGENTFCVIARELTKKFEEYIRGTLPDVYKELSGRNIIKGEIVVMVGPDAAGGITGPLIEIAEEENEKD